MDAVLDGADSPRPVDVAPTRLESRGRAKDPKTVPSVVRTRVTGTPFGKVVNGELEASFAQLRETWADRPSRRPRRGVEARKTELPGE